MASKDASYDKTPHRILNRCGIRRLVLAGAYALTGAPY